MYKTRNLVTDWRKGDAEKLVRMEHESMVAWPFGGGWQTTAEEEERIYREGDHLGAFVTEESGRIISICTIRAKPGQKLRAYVPYLNCHPDFHGRKYGKAALWSALECAYEAGYKMIDIHTWPANKKSVPLYKKMGFMWQPDSSGHLENFTPIARRHPLGAEYFSKHDWYQTQVRSLSLEEDLVFRDKVRVYEYLWRAENGDFFRMVFDRQSWGILEIENNDLLASCSLADEKLIAGISHPIEWRVVNKKSEPVSVFLSASGDPGIEIEQREMREVRSSSIFKGSFVIDPEISEKHIEPTAAIVHTDLVIEGKSIELAAGIHVRQAIDISVEASPQSVLLPGTPQSALITVRSNLDSKATANISVVPRSGTNVLKQRHTIAVGPKDGAEVQVPLQVPESGPVILEAKTNAKVGGKTIPVRTKILDLLAVTRGAIEGRVGEEHACLCSDGLMLFAGLRAGSVDIFHTVRAQRASRMRLRGVSLGPPFSWEDFFQEKAEASIERDSFGVTLCLRSPSIHRPGIMLERTLTLGQGPIIRVVDMIINGSEKVIDLSVRQSFSINMGQDSEMVIPRKQGIYKNVARSGGRNLGMLRLSDEGYLWPEGWMCFQRNDGCAAGIIWNKPEKVEPGNRCSIRQELGRLSPGQSKAVDPLSIFVGDGNWQTVQGWWRILIEQGIPENEELHPSTHRPVEISLKPNPLLISAKSAGAMLLLESVGKHKLDGRAVVELPQGLRSNPKSIEVAGLCESNHISDELQITTSNQLPAGPVGLNLRFETDEAIYRSSSRALVLSRKAPQVAIARTENGKVFSIDNGILIVKVAPGFIGSVISIQKDGKEYLNSPFPDARPWGWMNPWFGGLSPTYKWLWGQLHKERFRCRIVARKGSQGLMWHGVRVRCRIQQEHARGQSIYLDYLLAPGADVLAIILSCKNELGIRSYGHLGVAIHPEFAASPGTASFYNPSDESVTSLSPPFFSDGGNWNWGGIVARDGRALFLSANGEQALAGGQSEGQEGCIIEGQINGPLAARETLEGLFFLAPGLNETAETHAVWSEFSELP